MIVTVNVATSHLDHGVKLSHLEWLIEELKSREPNRGQLYIDTLTLPDELPSLSCGLHGPMIGDEPVAESEVVYKRRGERHWPSRLCARAHRPTRCVTVIVGPSGDEPHVLWTAFGGPLAPREPGDPALFAVALDEWIESINFWREHALSVEVES